MNTRTPHTGATALRIRPFDGSEADYRAVNGIFNANWPEYANTVEVWKHDDATRDKQYLFQRLVVERSGAPVAFALYAEPAWSYKPGKIFLNCQVLREHRGQGIGAACYAHALAALAERDVRELVMHIREDQTRAVRFARDRGFELVMRFPTSTLALEAFDFAAHDGVDERLRRQGIVVRSAAALAQADPDWSRKLHATILEVLQDVPSPDPITPEPYEQFRRRMLDNPTFLPEGNFVACEGERFVGYSALWKHEHNPRRLLTGLTGVVRGHRRRGVCTALKVHGFRFARAYGATEIETENEEHNPMYQLNLRLGFAPQPAWTNYVKTLRADGR